MPTTRKSTDYKKTAVQYYLVEDKTQKIVKINYIAHILLYVIFKLL